MTTTAAHRHRRGCRAVPLVAVTIAALFLLSGCVDRPEPGMHVADSEPRTGGTLVIAAQNDLEHANGLVAGEGYTQALLRFALFTPLIRHAPDGGYEPWLAERWEMMGDTGVVFHLRDDVRWHDGEPTTAYDVAFTFERARDPETAFPNAESYFGRWLGVEVLDPLTVRFTFEPHPDPLGGLPYFPIMPRHLLEEIEPARMRQASFNRAPVGNGPFRFVSYRSGDRWIFEANEDFPAALGGRPRIDRLVWRVVPESTAQVTELLASRADLILAPPSGRIDEFVDRPGVRVIEEPSRKYQFIAWNGQRRPFDDPRVRRALLMAVDRETILHVLRGGRGELGVGPVVPRHWAFADELEPLPYDPDAARALLREAGLRFDERETQWRLADGTPFDFAMTVPAGNQYSRNVAEMIQADLARIGVRMSLRVVDAATMFANLTSPSRPFDAIFLAWESDLRLDLSDMFHSRAIDGPFQFASYADPEVDRLLDSIANASDLESALPLWRRLQRRLHEDQPLGILFYVPDLYVVSERVRDMEIDARGLFVNLGSWWLADAP